MEQILKEQVRVAIKSLYNRDADPQLVQIQETRKDFRGHFTIVIFPLLKYSSRSPEETGDEIGRYIELKCSEVEGYNVIKGFLNLVMSDQFWFNVLNDIRKDRRWGFNEIDQNSPTTLVEYSSPNTNKPLHLGHIRNNLLGFSLSRILEAGGNRVVKTNIVNDRGIHICKSMVAWLKYGNGETPESSGLKGDHLAGKYYVRFEHEYRREIEVLVTGGVDPETAKNSAPLMEEARKTLVLWEKGDSEIIKVWNMMNSWVYEGFDNTYRRLGVDFDKIYYESDTYLLGKEIVNKALKEGKVQLKEDSSVWADLSAEGLDNKLLLRGDGTAVYITQDLGTAVIRYKDFNFDRLVYVVGNEQNYHFQVLKALLRKLEYPWAGGLEHFSYGMVELPEGKMKSREGKVVDADDLIDEMLDTAKRMSEDLGKLGSIEESEKEEIYRMVGLAALKYFILKVDPKKNMTFNPQESVDFNGNTGPFIQYTYARTRSILRKARDMSYYVDGNSNPDSLNEREIELIRVMRRFPVMVTESGNQLNPSLIANYAYDLAKEFNQFYHECPVLNETDEERKLFRLRLSDTFAELLTSSMWLLGIEMPERM
jgi:arginyl-tRNA synthetase